jgi:hypothetical protein
LGDDVRTIEWSGHPFGDAPAGHAGGMPSSSQRPGQEAGAEQHHLGSRLLDPLAARHAKQLAHAEDLAGGTDAAQTKTARKSGAKRATIDLNGPLGDDWIMFYGYRNASGPIGQLLLGPAGLIAMTSLCIDAEVHCRGDKWHAEKIIKGDSRKHELSLDDEHGRSPSVELNQATDTLEKFLHAAGAKLSVPRVVLLNHPTVREGEWHRPAVHVFGSTYDFLTWVHTLPKIFDRGQKRHLQELITGGDHQHPGPGAELAQTGEHDES